MVNNRICQKIIFLFSLAMIGLMIFAFMGCGGSGGGGNAPTSQPAPTTQSPSTTQQLAHINLSLTQIGFGDVFLNKFSDQTISIQSTGSSNLNIGKIAQADPLSTPFSILNDNCSGTQLPPSQTCTLQVRFSPTSQGGFNGSFDILSNDPNQNSVIVSISGSGRALGVAINKVDIASCPTVKVFVTVTDTNDNPLSGLLQNNFSLMENGVVPPIVSFSPVRLPISVALLTDYSGSIANVTSDIQAGATAFVGQLNPSNNDEGAIIKFAAAVNVVQPFTTDQNALIAAINAPFTGDPIGTVLYDALYSAIDITATRSNRGAIILISDGIDSAGTGPASVHTLPEVIAHAVAKGVNIFTIGLGDVNVGVMSQLATGTGGQYIFAPASNQLSGIYVQMSQILFGQYVIGYNSSSSGSRSVLLGATVNFNSVQETASTTFTGCP